MAELVETPQAHDQGRKGRGRCGRHRPEPGRRSPTCWNSPLLAAPTVSITPSLPRAESLHRELSSPFIITPTTPPRCTSRGTKSVLGAEVLYVVLGIVLLVLMAGIVR